MITLISIKIRRLLLVLFLLVTGAAQAQGAYFGVGLGILPLFISEVPLPFVPFLTGQYGAAIAEDLVLRVGLDSLVTVNDLSLDLLYRFPLSLGAPQVYAGGGSNLLLIVGGVDALPVIPILGLHATVAPSNTLCPGFMASCRAVCFWSACRT